MSTSIIECARSVRLVCEKIPGGRERERHRGDRQRDKDWFEDEKMKRHANTEREREREVIKKDEQNKRLSYLIEFLAFVCYNYF